MDDINFTSKVLGKVRDAAEKNEAVTLSAKEAKRVQDHIEWLSNERETLLNSGVFDED